MPAASVLLLAHQGGWDEFLLVAAPIVLLAFLLWVANRRADASLADSTRADSTRADETATDETPVDGS